MLCLCSGALTALLAPRPACAWGDEGHRIVARIAEHYLTPAARARVEALLATDRSGLVPDTSMESEATWADRYRDSDRNGARVRYEHTYRWHFIDLDLQRPDLDEACFGRPSAPQSSPASEGPARDCIVDKVEQFRGELASSATAPEERRLALQFLVHLMGDLHQPLHACTDHDHGGNQTHVMALGERAGSLHAYWDVEFVRRLGSEPAAVAQELILRIRPSDLAEWRRGRPGDWALESHEVARRIAYGRLPDRRYRGRYRLSDSYLSAATAAAAMQLSRAGVRLALVLNGALQ
jgi:hypothetical protein